MTCVGPTCANPSLNSRLISFSPVRYLECSSLGPVAVSFSRTGKGCAFFGSGSVLFTGIAPYFRGRGVTVTGGLIGNVKFNSSRVGILHLGSSTSLQCVFCMVYSGQFCGAKYSSVYNIKKLGHVGPQTMSAFRFAVPSLARRRTVTTCLSGRYRGVNQGVRLLRHGTCTCDQLHHSLVGHTIAHKLSPGISLGPSGVR